MLALGACVILAVAFWPEKPEPVYKGKTLSEWVLAATNPTNQSRDAVLSIRAIGTNGIPFYLEWMRYKRGIGKRAQIRLATYGNRWLSLNWAPDDSKATRARAAYQALILLGEPAIPQLVAFATNMPARPGVRFSFALNDPVSGLLGLARIGPPAVPAFLSLMTNPNPQVRASAITMSMANYDTSLVAQVRVSLQDADHQVRAAATNVMRTYDPDFGKPNNKP
jgi:hypothetical protein